MVPYKYTCLRQNCVGRNLSAPLTAATFLLRAKQSTIKASFNCLNLCAAVLYLLPFPTSLPWIQFSYFHLLLFQNMYFSQRSHHTISHQVVFDHISPVLAPLQQLPVASLICFKVLMLTCKTLQSGTPLLVRVSLPKITHLHHQIPPGNAPPGNCSKFCLLVHSMTLIVFFHFCFVTFHWILSYC